MTVPATRLLCNESPEREGWGGQERAGRSSQMDYANPSLRVAQGHLSSSSPPICLSVVLSVASLWRALIALSASCFISASCPRPLQLHTLSTNHQPSLTARSRFRSLCSLLLMALCVQRDQPRRASFKVSRDWSREQIRLIMEMSYISYRHHYSRLKDLRVCL